MKKFHFYILINRAAKHFSVALLLFISFCANAQDDPVVFDTTSSFDIEEKLESPFSVRSGNENDTIGFRNVPGEVITTIKKEDAFWYADSAFNASGKTVNSKNNTASPGKSNQGQGQIVRRKSHWLNIPALTVIVALFLGIVIWWLVKSNIVSGRKIRNNDGNDIADLENIFNINYEKEIARAVQNQDYRMATRLLFLRTLKSLSEKNIISFRHEKTNFEYLGQLYRTSYYDHFFRLTRNYEYVWYGKFALSSTSFDIVKDDFEKFNQKLG